MLQITPKDIGQVGDYAIPRVMASTRIDFSLAVHAPSAGCGCFHWSVAQLKHALAKGASEAQGSIIACIVPEDLPHRITKTLCRPCCAQLEVCGYQHMQSRQAG